MRSSIPSLRSLRGSRHALAISLAALGLLAPPAAQAATISKADNTDNLNLTTSWTGSVVPGAADIAQWTSTVTADNTTASLGEDLSWAGIKIVDPGGLVTIDPGNTLTVGTSGIDLSTATQDLTLNCGLNLRGGKQLWKAAASRTLDVAGTFTRTGAAVDFTNFNAAATLSGLANAGTTGILGPWATTGSGTSLNYVKSTAGAISTYTGQTDGTAGSLANVTDPNVNYKFGAAATLTGPITANTLLFNGAASILDNAGNTITLNGLLCPVANSLQIKGTGNLVIDATKELVVFWNKGQSRIDCPVVDNPAGDSAVTLNIASGANQVYLTANNTYKGGTTINGAGTATTIALDCNANSFGSGPITVNTYELRLVSNGTLTNSITLNGAALRGHSAYTTVFSGPITLNSPCYFYTSGTTTISGDMSGSGSFTLTPIGTGTTGTISGNNTYAGDTTVAANNTLKLGSNYAVPSGSGKGNVTVTGTLDLNACSPVVNGLSGAGTVDNKVAGTPLLTVGDNDQTSTFSGVIKNTAGTLSLRKLDSGTLTLSGANTYTGDTVVQNGTLSLSPTVAGGYLADTADVKLYTGGMLELNTSSTDTIRSLYIDGVGQVTGTWGGTGSTATNKTSLITGSGLLNVGTLGGTLTYSISGTVTLNGAGLAGVTVSDGMQSATTASDGTYTISAVPDNATYTVTASAGGYTFAPSSASVTVKGTNVTGNNYTATVVAGSITLTGPLSAVNTTYGTASTTPTSFSVSGTGLTPASGNLTVATLSGYEYSTSLGGTYTSTLLLPYTSSALSRTTVYVRLAATAGVGSSPYSGDISVSGGGAASPATIASASNTVSKAALSVTADNQTKGYGQTVAFGSGSTLFTSSSLQNGETITSVTLACDGGAAGAAAGIYPITPSAATGSLDPDNYDITYNITGELTVLDLNTYAFGTSITSVLVLDGDGKIVTRGQAPIIQTTEGSALVQLTYARLKDSGCTYSAEFSSNLGVWLPSDDPSLIYPPSVPTEVVVDNGDDMEVVSVKFPIFRDNGGSYEKMEQNFSRIKVTTQ